MFNRGILVLFASIFTLEHVKSYIVLKDNEETHQILQAQFNELMTQRYGDPCSAHSYDKFVKVLDAQYNQGQEVLARELLNGIVLDGEPHCDYNGFLVCSKSRQKCICGDAYEHVGYEHRHFVREGDICRLPADSLCYAFEHGCVDQSNCVLDSNHSIPCTEETIRQPLLSEHEHDHDHNGDEDGEIIFQSCSCQVVQQEENKGEDDEDKDEDEDEDEYEDDEDDSEVENNRVRRDAESEIDNLFLKVRQLSNLTLGEQCSVKGEDLRNEYYRALLHANLDIKTTSGDALSNLLEKGNILLQNGELLCNVGERIHCDDVSRRCECGEPIYRALEYPLPQYVASGGSCFHSKDSACSGDYCDLGATCNGIQHNTCYDASLDYIHKLFRRSPNPKVEDYARGHVQNEICTCQTEEGDDGIPFRVKRSSGLQQDMALERGFQNLF